MSVHMRSSTFAHYVNAFVLRKVSLARASASSMGRCSYLRAVGACYTRLACAGHADVSETKTT